MFPSAECTRYYEILACGLACSPAQHEFIETTAGVNTTTTFRYSPGRSRLVLSGFEAVSNSAPRPILPLRICSDFADEFYEACSEVVMGAGPLTVADVFTSAEHFIRMNTVNDRFNQVPALPPVTVSQFARSTTLTRV
jgi:hypothetical protein